LAPSGRSGASACATVIPRSTARPRTNGPSLVDEQSAPTTRGTRHATLTTAVARPPSTGTPQDQGRGDREGGPRRRSGQRTASHCATLRQGPAGPRTHHKRLTSTNNSRVRQEHRGCPSPIRRRGGLLDCHNCYLWGVTSHQVYVTTAGRPPRGGDLSGAVGDGLRRVMIVVTGPCGRCGRGVEGASSVIAVGTSTRFVSVP